MFFGGGVEGEGSLFFFGEFFKDVREIFRYSSEKLKISF